MRTLSDDIDKTVGATFIETIQLEPDFGEDGENLAE